MQYLAVALETIASSNYVGPSFPMDKDGRKTMKRCCKRAVPPVTRNA